MRARSSSLLTALLVVTLALAGCSAPAGTTDTAQTTPTVDDTIEREGVKGEPGSVGGKVKNSAPSFVTSAQSATTGENRGSFAVVFTGQVKDPNTERQLKNVSIRGVGPSTFASSHDITSDEVKAETEPEAFGADGWKVWVPQKNSGVAHFAYRFVFPALSPTGTYNFTMRVEDRSGEAAGSNTHPVVLTAYSDITISSTPVSASGTELAGQNWGQWDAQAGASNVESTNYIKLVNSGQVDGARVVIDFAPSFVGASDANFTIPVANNVQFAWWEDTSPGTTAPNEGSYSYESANADGSVTVGFTGKGNVIYVKYQIVAMPEIMPIQSYGITFTVTEL